MAPPRREYRNQEFHAWDDNVLPSQSGQTEQQDKWVAATAYRPGSIATDC